MRDESLIGAQNAAQGFEPAMVEYAAIGPREVFEAGAKVEAITDLPAAQQFQQPSVDQIGLGIAVDARPRRHRAVREFAEGTQQLTRKLIWFPKTDDIQTKKLFRKLGGDPALVMQFELPIDVLSAHLSPTSHSNFTKP
ncbi:hypothetical protein KHQ06_31115 [Nocardia tengchongensis]|uniref:Uncharacterized protein n=1 Tax=Nocardia tengchongensis TaxID=2055889 RepID=A0ABX8CKS2_9NOCA|nr:hypothetical protein [Nocardia tengchongensis]QVI20553.1 hypothetical protein KHQ06_31115 [Nocardia tengchongensis]